MSLQIGPETNWSRTSRNDELAATELLRRTEAAADLIALTEYTFPRYQMALIHRKIARQLERVERGEIDRLMLLVPPWHGKFRVSVTPLPGILSRQTSGTTIHLGGLRG
jgi:hypothetical protein